MDRFFTLLLCFMCTSIFCQIEGVYYQLTYDENTDVYSFYLHISKGRAEAMNQRFQSNSQISIVTPKGIDLKFEKIFEPKTLGGVANGWGVASIINAPTVTPNLKYHGIAPTLSPLGFYNPIGNGDVIKLFSFKTNKKLENFNDVRLFRNGQDPSAYEEGMKGGDFGQTFCIGQGTSKYLGNIEYGSITTDSEDEEEEKELVVYPNPAIDRVEVSGPKVEKLLLKTMNGKLIDTTYNSIMQMDGLNKGVYLLEVHGLNNSVVSKGVVKM